jgi:hypothetical protein
VKFTSPQKESLHKRAGLGRTFDNSFGETSRIFVVPSVRLFFSLISLGKSSGNSYLSQLLQTVLVHWRLTCHNGPVFSPDAESNEHALQTFAHHHAH